MKSLEEITKQIDRLIIAQKNKEKIQRQLKCVEGVNEAKNTISVLRWLKNWILESGEDNIIDMGYFLATQRNKR